MFANIPFFCFCFGVVDWSAHLGGLISGYCIGTVLFALELRKVFWKIFWLVIGVIITALYFSLTFTEMYSGAVDPPDELRDVCGYYKQYFNEYECNCMRGEHNNNNNGN